MSCRFILEMSKFLALVISYACLSLLVPVTAKPNDPGEYAREDLYEAEDAIHRALVHVYQCRESALTQPMDCADLQQRGTSRSGVYTVWPRSRSSNGRSLSVYCDMRTDGGGWTVIQRRGDYNRSMDYFFKDWECYKKGFGDNEKDFWLGNDAIFALSNQRQNSIRFDLGDFEGNTTYALYDQFWIEDEKNKYKINIRDYSGTAGDSMEYHDGQPFSTKAIDNDDLQGFNCANNFKGAWWYKSCHTANLNGLYKRGNYTSFADGVVWLTWKGYQYSLKTTEMKIRPKDFQRNPR